MTSFKGHLPPNTVMQNFTQQISCQLRIRKSKAKHADTPLGNVVIQVMIDGNADRVPLNLNWPIDKFDKNTESLLPRYDGDEQEAHRKNLYCKNELGKASKLCLQYYASEKTVTHKEFKKALLRYSSREDVLSYMEEKKISLVADRLVTEDTGKKYITCLKRLDEYMGTQRWRFNTLKYEDIQKFDSWIRRDPRWGHNTVCGTMRVLHKFFECAIADAIPFNNPMEKYSMPEFAEGVREIPTPAEYKILKEAYANGNLTFFEKDVLLRYLLSCNSGLRKSDIEQLDTRIHLKGNVLRLSMFKTRRYGKVVEFMVPKYFTELIGSRRGKLFKPMESAIYNKILRRIFYDAGGSTYLKFHSGRDFFGTNYIELGGNIKDLQEILGHGNIKYTLIYLKMSRRTKDNIIALFDTL
ncbi:MAG: tyrosine-type recombinase/integrase [Sphingobacteriaceae bacterium]|nr:tyrosine-type recombinase/integrase [Sphingobacteriaceae bacterium]